MSKSPYGNISRMNVEWSSKGRKIENDLRGLNHTARREAIAEQVAEMEIDEDIVLVQPDVEFEDGPWFNQGDGFEGYDHDDMDWIDAQFFDDPQ